MNECDKLYSPSFWTNRLETPVNIVTNHIQFIETVSRIIRRIIPCQLNLPYGSMHREKINIFGIDLQDDAPILVFIHGGYWQSKELGRESYEYIAQNFYKNKIKTIFIGYEPCPDVTLMELAQQVETAAKKCLDYAKNMRTKGLYLAGHSTGAHLVAHLFSGFINAIPPEDQKIIKAVFLLSGLCDLTPLKQTQIINQYLNLDEELALKMSPLHQNLYNGGGTQFHLFVGENESPAFRKQSEEFLKKLRALRFVATFAVVENVDHFQMVEMLYDDEFVVTRKIIGVIKGEDSKPPSSGEGIGSFSQFVAIEG